MKPIRTILWDIDGTLLDFGASERVGIARTFAHFGLGACTDAMLADYARINLQWWEKLECGACTKHETMTGRFAEFFAAYGICADVEAFNEEYQRVLPETVVFNEHGLETLLALKGRCLQYAVTNGNRPVQRKKLHDSGMDRIFDGIFISDEVGFEKPSPAFFAAVFDATGLDPEQTVIVGDSLTSDMRGGNNAGIRCCWYNPAKAPAPKALRIDYTIERLDEVLRLVEISQGA